MKVFVLDVPFSAKDEARKYKCWWDADNKRWEYRNEKKYESDNEVKLFVDTYTRVNIIASFDDKDEIKTNSGRWDAVEKAWFTYKGNEALKKFMPIEDKKIKKIKKVKNETEKLKITIPSEEEVLTEYNNLEASYKDNTDDSYYKFKKAALESEYKSHQTYYQNC